jgi:transcriptional regulator with XRE-family HTH domain
MVNAQRLNRELGKIVTQCRLDNGLSRDELAKATRIKPQAMADIESGKNILAIDLIVIAIVLDMDMAIITRCIRLTM